MYIHLIQVKHTMVTTKALDRLNISNLIYWKQLENNIDRLLHKLRRKDIFLTLDLFDKVPGRMSEEFFHKMISILPIHVENMSSSQLIRIIDICVNHNHC